MRCCLKKSPDHLPVRICSEACLGGNNIEKILVDAANRAQFDEICLSVQTEVKIVYHVSSEMQYDDETVLQSNHIVAYRAEAVVRMALNVPTCFCRSMCRMNLFSDAAR